MMRHREKISDVVNTGFGPQSAVEGSRLINKQGDANLRKIGLPIWERISIYHTLLRMSRGKFLLIVFLFYASVNVFFASLYYMVGVEHLLGAEEGSRMHQFMDAFFFSAQTLTTVGYGHVAPTGMATNTIAAIESLTGILVFALVTGLIYGRFAKPRAYIIFSDNIIVAPYKNDKGLMFRIATYKNNHLTDVEATLTLAIHEFDTGKQVTKFYQLPLEIAKINSLALSWTIVHNINEKSPLYGFTNEDFANHKIELIVTIKAFDDHFSNIVQQRTSYTYQEVIYGAKFLPMFRKADTGTHTILELHKVNAYEQYEFPAMLDTLFDNGSMVAKQ